LRQEAENFDDKWDLELDEEGKFGECILYLDLSNKEYAFPGALMLLLPGHLLPYQQEELIIAAHRVLDVSEKITGNGGSVKNPDLKNFIEHIISIAKENKRPPPI
jgi:hypothetical protein